MELGTNRDEQSGKDSETRRTDICSRPSLAPPSTTSTALSFLYSDKNVTLIYSLHSIRLII